MRYFEKVEKTEIVSELRGIQCNKCGEIFQPNYGNATQQLAINVGYNSIFPSSFKFDLCEECLSKIIKEFLIVPDNFMNCDPYDQGFVPDNMLHQQQFDLWKLNGEWPNSEDDICEGQKEDNYDEYYYESYEDYVEEENNQQQKSSTHYTLRIVK